MANGFEVLAQLTSNAMWSLFRMYSGIISNLLTMCIPGLLDGFVVARHPQVSAHLTAFNIVTDQLLDFLRSPPYDHHRGVRVPDDHWVARGGGHICRDKKIDRGGGGKILLGLELGSVQKYE